MITHPSLDNNRMGSSLLNESVPNTLKSASFGPKSNASEVVIIKKKKAPVSFERRFLSAYAKSDDCILEIAMIWHGNVMNIQQYPFKSNLEIAVGETNDCQYRVNPDHAQKRIVIAKCDEMKQWTLLQQPAQEGFLVMGDRVCPFQSAPASIELSNTIRAKYIFGDVAILVHYVDRKTFAASHAGLFNLNRYGALVASLLLHFAVFSVALFASDRVDALIVDRIMTSARFASMVEPIEQVIEEDPIIDEVIPEENTELTEVTEIKRDAPSSPIAKPDTNSNAPSNRAEAIAAANGSGLLAQDRAMESMLAAATSMQDFDNLEWNVFDSTIAAQNANYGLGILGDKGGGSRFGRYNGGYGPAGTAAHNKLHTAMKNDKTDLGTIEERIIDVKPGPVDTSGSLDKRIIQKTVRNHTNEVRSCYERELNKIKGLNGRVVFVWIISPQGDVQRVIKKETTIRNANVENCVQNSIKYWRFPAAKNGNPTMVEYPFVFNVSGSSN